MSKRFSARFIMLIYIVIGFVIAVGGHYITVSLLKDVVSAVLAIFLWWLPLLGVSLHRTPEGIAHCQRALTLAEQLEAPVLQVAASRAPSSGDGDILGMGPRPGLLGAEGFRALAIEKLNEIASRVARVNNNI